MIWFESERLVDWGDCDAAGIIFFPNFFAYVDGHFHKFTTSLGFDHRSLLADYGLVGTPLRKTECTFHSPATYGDTLQIASRITHLGASSLSSTYRFSRGDTFIAEAKETRVMVRQSETGIEKAEFPAPIRALLEPRVSPH
ncbi:MAG: acyl-CoA thioesterase [Acuticoccus sp.]